MRFTIIAGLIFAAPAAEACVAEFGFFRDTTANEIEACLNGDEGDVFLAARDEGLSTVLHMAVSAEVDTSILDAIRRKASGDWDSLRNSVDSTGRTALHYAALTQSPVAVHWLLNYGAAPDPIYANEERRLPGLSDYGISPLHLAAERADGADHVSALIAGGADPDLRRPSSDQRWTAAIVAARNHDETRTLMALVAGGADLTAQDINGNTALHVAAFWNRPPNMLQFLLEGGVDPNKENDEGQLALHAAARYAKETASISLLLEVTDAPCAEDDDGRTPKNLLTANPVLSRDKAITLRLHEMCVEGQ